MICLWFGAKDDGEHDAKLKSRLTGALVFMQGYPFLVSGYKMERVGWLWL